jgi:hypothetical protein
MCVCLRARARVCVCVCVCGALVRSKLPEDEVLTPKNVRVILILILHYMSVHMLVHNKHLYNYIN